MAENETNEDVRENAENEDFNGNIEEGLEDAPKEGAEQNINAKHAAAAAAYAQAAKEAGAVVDEVADEDVTVEDETETLKKELADSESSLKRLRADFENFRRRTNKEKEEVGQVVREECLRSLLPLLDNFERAMATEDKTSDSFVEGVNMIFGQFGEILKNFGLEEIEAAGNMFDPNFHQAVGRTVSETLPDGAIAAVFQKGYKVKDRVLRPAMVQVVGE